MRVHNMLAAAACVACGYHLSGGTSYDVLLYPIICTALATGFGNLINDYFDSDIDRVNKPHRPIPSGLLTRDFAVRLYWAGVIFTTALMASKLPRDVFLLMTCWQVLLYVYARFGKRIALAGNVLISGIAGSSFIAGAMLTGNYRMVIFPVAFAFLLVMGRELVKGAEDVRGDRLAGASTLAVRVGEERTLQWGSLTLFLCVLAAPLPAFLDMYSRAYGIAVEVAFVPGVLLASFLALRSTHRRVLRRVSSILKVEMFLGLVAIALGPM